MNISNGNNFFSFTPLGYEFDLSNCKNVFDLNWLKIQFKFNYKDEVISLTSAEFSTFEIYKFIRDLENSFQNNNDCIVKLELIEPCFSLSINKISNSYFLKGSYRFLDNGIKKEVFFENQYDKLTIRTFIDELKLEYENYPYRRILKYKTYESFKEMAHHLSSLSDLKAKITYDIHFIKIEFHNDFIIEITDFPVYHTKINNKYYNINEQNIVDWIKEVSKGTLFFVEYDKKVGIFNRGYFKKYTKNSFNVNKIPYKKHITKIFTANAVIK